MDRIWSRHRPKAVIKPGPGIIVKIVIMPGIEKSPDLNRTRYGHRRNIVIKPGPGRIVKIAILPGIDETLDLNRIG